MKKRVLFSILAIVILFFLPLFSQNLVFANDYNPGYFPDAITVKGLIKDQNSNPLAGANITEKNTNNTTKNNTRNGPIGAKRFVL